MRLRTTAAAVVGALALVLPASGQAFAADGDFHYTFVDHNGAEQSAQIRDLENDKCLPLEHTSAAEPAVEVANETDAVALLFDNAECKGEPRAVAGPGERAGDVHAVAVVFEAAQDEAKPLPAQDEAKDDAAKDDMAKDEMSKDDAAKEPTDAADAISDDVADDFVDEEESDLFSTVFRAID
ncbi:hypothetical protein [Streptomyces bambusae]|uniref:Secreted protein n=1 Tax=Streptomyces bambusae TaxID=1550616 RepID=A0ABS6Z427_9ACTN|nr:hypothetical protein [Streptomyces bambusae]MBW5482513.1 hypothetical protein [Streptomyces bambusae]